MTNYKQIKNTSSEEKTMGIVVHCKDCVFARKRYGKLECINGISYRNTYNDPNMFCSYGKTAYEDQSTSSSKNQINSLSNLNK